ncbi:27552_t:CDS:2 [Racocetra persica]|uniref:27552_t:CDS:1 n=1 Tax=Racocetra persica TaxID=160502 RepID=A0ACA9P1U8_9GLOM|nr:27552_t:CDS:2 [Racocetra persica]
MLSEDISSLKEENARLMAKIIGLEARNVKLEDENMKLRTEFKSRIEELEKSRSDIAGENARRDDAIAELKAEVLKLRDDNEENKQAQDISLEEVNNVPNLFVDHPSNDSPSPCEEDRKTEEFLDSVQKKSVSDGIREKFIQKVSSDLIQSDTDLAKQQLVILSSTSSPYRQADSSSFAHLYEKLRDAENFADRAVQEAIIYYCQFGKALIQRRGEIASERQVDPESNAVSRVLNMEVRVQLPANTSDALLWKRIEQAKKL